MGFGSENLGPESKAQVPTSFFHVFRSRRIAVLAALGFSSGLPLYLTGQTLQAWMSSRHVDLKRIAAMSAVGLAYSLKFAWAPLLDRYRLPVLGRRRGWMLGLQLALVAAIATMGAIDPVAAPVALAAAAAVVAFLSASQDVVLDAYAADVLAPEQRAAGQAVYVVGYRVGLLVAGSLALVLADHLAWPVIYAVMAAAMVVGVAGTFAAEEPATPEQARHTLATALVEPFRELAHRLGGGRLARLLAFAALYELGYFFAQAVIIPFLHDGVGFDFTTIGVANKALVFAGTAVGGFASGALVARWGPHRLLVPFGALALATHLLYALLALAGHSLPMLCVAVLADSIANALVMTAFVAVLMGTCSPAFSATQLAILTSLSSVGQRVLGPFAANVQVAVGWAGFFVVTAAMTVPGLVLARRIAQEVAAGGERS
ncbi:MAG TPA: MFS transporter [Kofleriaceae bacterium]|nr:MFS transporter [Kofleriaceae bacterium]